MISLVKIVTEGYAFDADDYIPYNNLKVGDIVRFIDNEEEQYKILSIEGDGKLIISLVDDPRDIKAVFYDDDVQAHASDQNSDEDDEELNEVDVDLADKEREANAEPEQSDEFDSREILPKDCEVVAMSEGFDTVKLEEAIESILNNEHYADYVNPTKDKEGDILPYRYVGIRMNNCPGKITAGPSIDVNFTGKYLMPKGSYSYDRDSQREERKCDTPETAAPKVENLLKGMASPAELKQHILGWILVDHHIGTYSAEFYPYLDEGGVRIYLEAEGKLTADVNKFYAGTNYWGD